MLLNFEIEIQQLLYLTRILDKKNDDPVQLCYREMLTFSEEVNWANDVIGLRKKYNLPLHDDNVKNMGVKDWKWIVKRERLFWNYRLNAIPIRRLVISLTNILAQVILLKLSPELARLVFKAKTRIFDIKVITRRSIEVF